jgi:hypothetical protein
MENLMDLDEGVVVDFGIFFGDFMVPWPISQRPNVRFLIIAVNRKRILQNQSPFVRQRDRIKKGAGHCPAPLNQRVVRITW